MGGISGIWHEADMPKHDAASRIYVPVGRMTHVDDDTLWGDAPFESTALYQRRVEPPNLTGRLQGDQEDLESSTDIAVRPTGLAGFFFGFMYEDPVVVDLSGHEAAVEFSYDTPWCNTTIAAICSAYALSSMASSASLLLIPEMAVYWSGEDARGPDSLFVSHATSLAVLGTAAGKFVNGPIGEIVGSRRTLVVFHLMLAFALAGLGVSHTQNQAILMCFVVEFLQSVQWPCLLICLAKHFDSPTALDSRFQQATLYDRSIAMASVAARIGFLAGIILYSTLLQTLSWRHASFVGAWLALLACSIYYLYLRDSPEHVHDPHAPLQATSYRYKNHPPRILNRVADACPFGLAAFWHISASVGRVVKSGTFWVLALAHTGSSMVRTSDHILTTYMKDTAEASAESDVRSTGHGSPAIWFHLGSILGLMSAGTYFASCRNHIQRRYMVSCLYVVMLSAIYGLAILGMTLIVSSFGVDLTVVLQLGCCFLLGFCSSVVYYQIPALVARSISYRGIFVAYLDGVAYGCASWVWEVVGQAVQGPSNGWAYGWAGVALVVLPCAVLMVEFMEHFFVRTSSAGRGYQRRDYETILYS